MWPMVHVSDLKWVSLISLRVANTNARYIAIVYVAIIPHQKAKVRQIISIMKTARYNA